ncbi:class I SAM-dependent methyltransferase [Laceyella putida]|uniref:Class I SAM-dependent methyltransferase n=1 Tax=Laceyella putida TaxID=110101 RepID=A0ABW2RLH7_9BACL
MILPSILSSARTAVKASCPPGSIAVDGTLGNGHDTLFLAECVGPSGHVYGFDIQQAAVERTDTRLSEAGQRKQVTLFHASHHLIAELLPREAKGRIRAFMFNLGYLPHGDEQVITQPDTTLEALRTAADWLAPGGIISVALYTGHPGGPEEATAVIDWARSLPPQDYQVMWQQMINRNKAPSLLLLEKRTKKRA